MMHQDIVTSCLSDTQPLYRSTAIEEDDPKQIATHIAPITPPATRDIVSLKKSRFSTSAV